MAKKVKISEKEKASIIESESLKQEEDIIENVNRKRDLLKVFSIICNIALIIVVIALLVSNDNTKKEMQDKIDSIDTTCAYKTEFACKMEYYDEIDKAEMLDENIVFVLEGYGNVYYTYDCVTKLTAGSKYSYWAYNKEAAISKGYKAGKC